MNKQTLNEEWWDLIADSEENQYSVSLVVKGLSELTDTQLWKLESLINVELQGRRKVKPFSNTFEDFN